MAGSDKIPPRMGPTMIPMLKVIGRIKKALDWYFFSLIVSLILGACQQAQRRKGRFIGYMVLSTPMFPLVMPPRARKQRAWANEVEKPNPTDETTEHELAFAQGDPHRVVLLVRVPPSPIIKTVLRPNRWESATRPQTIAVKNWAAVKLALS